MLRTSTTRVELNKRFRVVCNAQSNWNSGKRDVYVLEWLLIVHVNRDGFRCIMREASHAQGHHK